MSSDDIRRKARSDFVYRRMTAKTIATAYDISEATFGRWKKKAKEDGDDWDAARAASVMAGQGVDAVVSSVLEDFMIQAQGLMAKIKEGELSIDLKIKHLVALADAMTKMTASAGRLAPKISELGVAQTVVEELIEFVRTKFPHHLDAIRELIEPFGERLSKRFRP